MKAQKANNKSVCQLIIKCAKELSEKQLENLPPEIKVDVMNKYEKIKMRKLM